MKSTLIIALSLIIGTVQAFAQTANIIHTPVAFADKYHPVKVEAQLDGDPTGTTVTEAILHFNDPISPDWDYVEMSTSADGFLGEIPVYATGGDQLSYYIEMTRTVAGKEQIVTYPAQNPQRNPQKVALKSPEPSAKVLNAKGKTGLQIWSPAPGGTIPPGDMVIMIYIDPQQRVLLKDELSIKVDGKEYAQDAEVTDQFLTLVVSDVKEGKHKVDITNKKRKDAIFRFDVTASASASASGMVAPSQQSMPAESGRRLPFSGSVGTRMTYQDLNGSLYRTARERVNLRGNTGGWRYNLKGEFSSEESVDLQPQNRYSVELGKGRMNLRLLDVYPRYNELVLWGKRTRGGEIAIDGKKGGSFSVVYGELLRAVDNDIAGIDTVFYANNPTVIDRIDTTFTAGTPKRWMGAMRMSFGDPNRFNWGFTAMKVKDDPESINYSQKPKDNFVTGLDFRMRPFSPNVSLKSSWAFSMYNDNINSPVFSQTESIKDIIWVNQYFTPTPEDTATDAGSVFSGTIKNTMSHKTELSIQAMGNYLTLGYYSYAKSFRTLAMPSLSTDRSGFFIRDQLPLYDGRINLSGGLTSLGDNLSGKNPITNSNLMWDFMIAAYPGQNIPDLSFNMSSQSNTNEVDAAFASSEVDNSVSSMGFNLSQEYDLIGTQNRFNFGISSSEGTDEFDTLNTSSQSMWNFSVLNRTPDWPMATTLAYSASNSESFGGGTNMDFNNLTLKFKFDFLGGKLRPWISPRFISKSGENNVSPLSPEDTYTQLGMDMSNPDVAAKVDTLELMTIKDIVVDQKQTNLNAGVEYEFMPRHNLRLDVIMTSYNESNKNRYWNGSEYDSAEESITNSDGVNTVTFDQPSGGERTDDLIMMLGYTYRF